MPRPTCCKQLSAFKGYTTGGSPHRLRYDYLSDDQVVTLEPSFEGEGVVIKRSLDDLVQVRFKVPGVRSERMVLSPIRSVLLFHFGGAG